MINIIITLLVVFYRIPLVNILGDKGMGYYSVAFAIYSLLMTCIAYGLPQTVSKIIEKQHSNGQSKLVYKTMKCSIALAVISGGILAILIYSSADLIASYIMNAAYSAYAIRAFAPCVLFVSILGAFHGIYTGTKSFTISKIATKTEQVFVAILSIIGAYVFTNIGNNVMKTTGDLLLGPAYTSMGTAIGFTCGVFLTCVFLIILFINYHKKFKRFALKDKESKKLRNTEIVTLIIKSAIPSVSIMVIYYLSNLLEYAFFNRIMSVQGHKENSYIILLGMLNGKYDFFISLPLFFVTRFIISKIPAISKALKSNNKKKLHMKVSQYVRHTMLYIIPCSVLLILYSTPLMNFIFDGINDTPGIMLKVGAVSIICYSLAIISSITLKALDEWMSATKNAVLSLVIQLIGLLIMLIIFQWGIIAVVFSRTLFAAALFILNEHTLRERTGYIQEKKRTFTIPIIASLIMSGVSFLIYILFQLFHAGRFSIIIVLMIAIIIYILALVFLGGITQREMHRLPGGKLFAPLCKKLHLIK